MLLLCLLAHMVAELRLFYRPMELLWPSKRRKKLAILLAGGVELEWARYWVTKLLSR